MKLTDIFIKRPVLATVVSLLILLLGFRALMSLNVRQYPDVKDSTVTVSVAYPGASAELMQGFVTTPLEREIASADGIDYLTSSSEPNLSTITAKLRLNYDPNAALTQITSKVNKVRNQLPASAQDPVIEVSTGELTAAMYINFASEVMDANQITDYLTRVVQPKIATVAGVQKAEILGARTFSMRIWLKPEKVAAYGMSGSQIWSVLAQQNYLSAVGATKGSMVKVNLDAKTDLTSVEDFKNIVVKQEGSQIIRLRDVADVVLGAEDYSVEVQTEGKQTTMLAVSALPTANVLDVVARVKEVLPEIEAQLPQGLLMRITYDSTEYIQESIDEVVKTLIEAVLIVIVVIYFFLGSFRTVIIPIVAIPLSLIGGFFLMMVMGFTINLLTLLAMVLAIGMVVDDAIVVVENVHRHIEEGLPRFEAALKGAGELVGPVIAMTITLLAVFAPLGLQSGLTGMLFREFAFTMAGCVLISGVVALTLSPMMCSKVLKHDVTPRGLARKVDEAFDRLSAFYSKMLEKALLKRHQVYLIAAILIVSIWPLYSGSQSELAPTEDRGFVIAMLTTAPNSSIEQTSFYSNQLEDALRVRPETQQTFAASGIMGGNSAFVGWVLKPYTERNKTTMQLAALEKTEIAKIAGATGAAFIPPSLPGGGRGMPVQFIVCSTEAPERVAEVAQEIVRRAMESGKFFYADSDLKFDQPQTDVIIDRAKAGALGIPMQGLSSDLGAYFGGNYVNWFSIDGRSYKVIPQVTRLWRLNPEQLNSIYILGGKGEVVLLSTVARLEQSVKPRSLNRFQQLNAATISMMPASGVSLGDSLQYLNGLAAEVFPQGFTADYGGELRQYVQEGSSLVGSFVLAIIIIYLVLAAQYESFRDPLIILMSVPLAIAGALIFINLGFSSINIYTQVGLIALVGLVSKNGILIVEFANTLREGGMEALEAVQEAARLRLRPILMTSFSTVLGAAPLLFAQGPGGTSRFSMGLVMVAGMTIGTIFTLFVVPAFYVLISGKEIRKVNS